MYTVFSFIDSIIGSFLLSFGKMYLDDTFGNTITNFEFSNDAVGVRCVLNITGDASDNIAP